MKTHIYHLAILKLSADLKVPSIVEILETKTTKRRLSEREIADFAARRKEAQALKEISGQFFAASLHGRDYYHQIFGGWGAEPIVTQTVDLATVRAAAQAARGQQEAAR